MVNTKALYSGKKQNNSNSQGISEGQGNQGSKDGDPYSNTYTNVVLVQMASLII